MTLFSTATDLNLITKKFPAVKVNQPLGEMFVASMPFKEIAKVAHFDVRRMIEDSREIETYLGVQRPLIQSRVKEIAAYVNFRDATFPGAVIVSVDEDYCDVTESQNGCIEVTFRNYRIGEVSPSIMYSKLARVLDGQHRLAGLEDGFKGTQFDIIVVVLIGLDISDQATVFATVNLEQKKVHKSLVYDLFALGKTRSPQRTCHDIAIAFDRNERSPFFQRIKRLGSATPGRDSEWLSQATFVEGIIGYISKEPKLDRDRLLRGLALNLPTRTEIKTTPFRRMFVEERDADIALTLHEYFCAVKERWPEAWGHAAEGRMLHRTNGFRALCRFARDAFLVFSDGTQPVYRASFKGLFDKVPLKDEDFTIVQFQPGTAGEAKFYSELKSVLALPEEDD